MIGLLGSVDLHALVLEPLLDWFISLSMLERFIAILVAIGLVYRGAFLCLGWFQTVAISVAIKHLLVLGIAFLLGFEWWLGRFEVILP